MAEWEITRDMKQAQNYQKKEERVLEHTGSMLDNKVTEAVPPSTNRKTGALPKLFKKHLNPKQ